MPSPNVGENGGGSVADPGDMVKRLAEAMTQAGSTAGYAGLYSYAVALMEARRLLSLIEFDADGDTVIGWPWRGHIDAGIAAIDALSELPRG